MIGDKPFFNRRQLNYIIVGTAVVILLLSLTGRREEEALPAIQDWSQDHPPALFALPEAGDAVNLRLTFRLPRNTADDRESGVLLYQLLSKRLMDSGIPQRLEDEGGGLISQYYPDRLLIGLQINTKREVEPALAQLLALLQPAIDPQRWSVVRARRQAQRHLDRSVAAQAPSRLFDHAPQGKDVDANDLAVFITQHIASSRLVMTLHGDIDRPVAERLLANVRERLPAGMPVPPAPVWEASSGRPSQVEGIPVEWVQGNEKPRIWLGRTTAGRDGRAYPQTVLAVQFLRARLQELEAKVRLSWERGAHQGELILELQDAAPGEEAALLQRLLLRSGDKQQIEAARQSVLEAFRLQLQTFDGRTHALALVAFHGLAPDYLSRYVEMMTAVPTESVSQQIELLLEPEAFFRIYQTPVN
jgi:hypothetical protein